jgi:hypothetical protein
MAHPQELGRCNFRRNAAVASEVGWLGLGPMQTRDDESAHISA